MSKYAFYYGKKKATNAIDPATTASRWGKKVHGYPGCAGKGGNTTNFEIPEWMFQRELEDMMGVSE